VPRQRAVKVAAQSPQAVGESGPDPHRARRRWRPGATAHWVQARHGSGGGQSVLKLGDKVVDELPQGDGQRSASVALWLRQTIDDPVFVDLFDALKGERWACTVAKQPLQSGLVVAGDAHRGVEREAAVNPGEHVAGVIGIEQAVAGEPVQHAAADVLLDRGSRFRRQCQGNSELDPANFERLV
jgi:hypothetical protein